MFTVHRADRELTEQCLGLAGAIKGEETGYEGSAVLAERIKENLL